MTHILVGKLTIIGSNNGLSPGRRQAIIWTNDGILLIGPLGTNFNEILIGIQTFSFKKMHLKVSSAKWRSCCLGLNVLTWLLLGWRLCFPLVRSQVWKFYLINMNFSMNFPRWKNPYMRVIIRRSDSGVLCQKQVSRAGTSNYIPQIPAQ